MDYVLAGFITSTVLLWFGGGWVIAAAYVADTQGDKLDYIITWLAWPVLLIWVAAEELLDFTKTKIKGLRK